jgi:hypothetical protein
MTYAVRSLQARCAALGFWPGPIDGIMGRRTREAEAAARASQAAKGLPFIHPTGLTRVHGHWTGGWHKANSSDKRAYHRLIEGDGTVLRMADPWLPRSHTLNANGGAVGVSMCCMVGAVERPFSWGSAPMTTKQLHAMAEEVARLCIAFDIPVSRWSVLTHAEVQPAFGIKQKWKWDINILPGMERPGDPIEVGDRIRDIIRAKIKTAIQ